MKSLYTSTFGYSQAFAMMSTLAQLARAQRTTLDTFEFPNVGGALALWEQRDKFKFRELVTSVERKTEIVGYNMTVDLEGKVLRRYPIKKAHRIYHLNPEKLDRLMADLLREQNQEAIKSNIAQMQNLL